MTAKLMRNVFWKGQTKVKYLPVSILLLLTVGIGAANADTGKDWTAVPWNDANDTIFSSRDLAGACVFDGQMWVVGGGSGAGYLNDVWSSVDGMHWTQLTSSASFSPRIWHQTVAFQNKLWVIGGFDGTLCRDVWNSNDGVQWTRVTGTAAFPGRTQFSCLVYGGMIWLIGGWDTTKALSDVWYTSNGKDWFLATSAAPFGGRAMTSSAVFDGKMWISGGYYSLSGILNDVWWSTDGVTWTQAAGATRFSPRWGHSMAATADKMYVMGGCNGAEGTNLKNDVWSSSDGITWTQVSAGAPFSPRMYTSSLFFGNRIWLLGGQISQSYNMAPDDVWYSDAPLTPVELSGFRAE